MLFKKTWDVQRYNVDGKLNYRAMYDVWFILFLPVFIKQTYLYNPFKQPETFLSGQD